MHPTHLAVLAGKPQRGGGPLRNVVDERLGYVGPAPRVGTSREGGNG
jgi:hypothetical protein